MIGPNAVLAPDVVHEHRDHEPQFAKREPNTREKRTRRPRNAKERQQLRADAVTSTCVPWLTGPIGMITVTTLDALAAALRTEMDLRLSIE